MLLDQSFYVAISIKESLLVKYMYKSCDMFIANKNTIVNLIVSNMLDFDVILGMNWLATYYAILDYHLKMVKFNPPGELFFLVQRDRSSTSYNLIFRFSARKLLKKGCQGFLALVRDVKIQWAKLENVSMINEFCNFFLKEFPSLPLERKIKFCINLVSNT